MSVLPFRCFVAFAPPEGHEKTNLDRRAPGLATVRDDSGAGGGGWRRLERHGERSDRRGGDSERDGRTSHAISRFVSGVRSEETRGADDTSGFQVWQRIERLRVVRHDVTHLVRVWPPPS